ncbi:hypothetical protein SOASR014_42090 [Pectobacterium carotovorum subsp. carotovorum]|nr:hypothetical protein SOASR014_42090 [Pectobacterium carotovorum subsp. carotovorum]GLX46514.1 hypothetical protein Pcaca01_41820 [Pectobacterium carotovorum subsp. carotovorum]
MSEITDLTVVEIKPEKAPVLYAPNGPEDHLNHIREMAKEVPDVNTDAGRKRIGSLARAVGSSKKAIENPGRAYLKRLKEAVKPAEEELKRFVDACDDISKAILKPRVEWEAEQERIAAEKAAEQERLRIEAEEKAALEALKKQIEADHEISLLLNDKFDRDLLEAQQEAERQRIAHEEELKRQAAEQAKREAAEAAQREIDAAAAREREALLAKERAEREAKEAAEQAERNRIAAEQRAEREKQEAIEKVQREAAAKEAARLAEEKRIADEAEARAANEKHRKAIGTEVVNALIAHAGLSRVQAIDVLMQIKDGNVPHTRITY